LVSGKATILAFGWSDACVGNVCLNANYPKKHVNELRFPSFLFFDHYGAERNRGIVGLTVDKIAVLPLSGGPTMSTRFPRALDFRRASHVTARKDACMRVEDSYIERKVDAPSSTKAASAKEIDKVCMESISLSNKRYS
jgi:hypothetical protein